MVNGEWLIGELTEDAGSPGAGAGQGGPVSGVSYVRIRPGEGGARDFRLEGLLGDLG